MGDTMREFNDVIEEVKYKADIVDVISDYVRLKPSGNGYVGLCPFHNEKTPSFHVNQDKQIYKCFGCGEGGDVLNFIMNIENLEFMDALENLGKRYGINVDILQKNFSKEDYEKYQHYLDIYLETAKFYYLNLRQTDNPAIKYIEKRGLSDEILKKFGIGYSPNSWSNTYEYLKNNGFTDDDIEASGICKKTQKGNYYDVFRGRLMFPIFDYRGRVIAFGGRQVEDSDDKKSPKYLNSPETRFFNKRNNLYGLNLARKNISKRTIILVEGYMDLISMYQAGFKNVVATLGTALTQNQASLIKNYADTVIICYDSDQAGKNAARRAIDILFRANLSIKVMNMIGAKDPDEYIKKFGSERFSNLIRESDHYLKFIIDICSESYNLSNDDDKIQFIRKAGEELSNYASPAEREIYTNYIAKYTGIETNTVELEINRTVPKRDNFLNLKYPQRTGEKKGVGKDSFRKNRNLNKNKTSITRISSDASPILKKREFSPIDIELLRIMIEDKNMKNEIALNSSGDYFGSNYSKNLYNFLLNDKNLGINSIDKLAEEGYSEAFLNELRSFEFNKDSINESYVLSLLSKQKESYIRSEINKYSNLQNELEESLKVKKDKGVEDRLMEIVFKIIELNKELKKI